MSFHFMPLTKPSLLMDNVGTSPELPLNQLTKIHICNVLIAEYLHIKSLFSDSDVNSDFCGIRLFRSKT